MTYLRRAEWVVVATLVAFSFIPTFGGLVRIFELTSGFALMPANSRAMAQPLPILLHVLSSFVFCLAGALQFLPSLRKHHGKAHRRAGYVIAGAGMLSAATGVWMTMSFAFPAELQGPVLYWVRVVLGILMAGLIIWGVVAARARNIPVHRAAMIRAYAIGVGASTQTVLGILALVVLGTDLTGPHREAMMVGAWVLNLCVAELLIRRHISAPAQAVRL